MWYSASCTAMGHYQHKNILYTGEEDPVVFSSLTENQRIEQMDGQTDRWFVLQQWLSCIVAWHKTLVEYQERQPQAPGPFMSLIRSVLTNEVCEPLYKKGKGARHVCFRIKHNLDLSDIDWIILRNNYFLPSWNISHCFFVKPHLSVSTLSSDSWLVGKFLVGNYSGSTWLRMLVCQELLGAMVIWVTKIDYLREK